MASSATTSEMFVDKSYQNAFMQRMHRQRLSDEYTDVTLQSSDIDIRCHRNVLAAASDYLNAMFRCGLEESTVHVDMQSETLTAIVEYIYTGQIELTIDTIKNVVKPCDVLQLDTLKTACESFMLKHVEPANCVGLHILATSYHLDKLQEDTRRLMRSEFRTVAFTDDFKALSCNEVIECVNDDDVNTASEDIVFEAVLAWVQHDIVNRKSSLEAIMEHIRFPYCTSDFVQHMKSSYHLLTPKCFEYLLEAMTFKQTTVHQHEVSSCRTVPRSNFKMKSCLLLVGGQRTATNGRDVKNYDCEYYEEHTGCWKPLTTLPPSVSNLDSVCHTDRGLVVTGGSKGGVLDQCLLLDIATKEWTTMPPFLTARCYHRSVSLGYNIYVVGGRDGDKKPLASVECLSLKSRQWPSLPDMEHAVYAPMVTTYRKQIFVFGGLDEQAKEVCFTQVFDTTLNEWSTLSPMPMKCRYGAAVTLNNSTYVVGGFSKTCLKYDPASDVWTKLSRPQQKHGNAPAVVWRGSILLAAGDGVEPNDPSSIEQFDPLSNTWSNSNITQLKENLEAHYLFNVDLYGL